MAKPLSKERAEEILGGDDREAICKAFKRLPDDVDPLVACDLMLPDSAYPPSDWSFELCHEQVPAVVIREFVKRIAPTARNGGRYYAVLVSSIVVSLDDDAKLTEEWRLAFQTLLDLGLTYGWGSRQRKERLLALANNPVLLRAIQTVSVACEPSIDVLAVLVADGSDDSIDALMPHIDAAENDGPRLQQLTKLRTHANPKSKSIEALLDLLDRRLEQRSAASPAIALAAEIGVKVGELFWFNASVSSDEPGRISRYQAHVTVDSRKKRWFSVEITEVDGLSMRSTSFSSEGTSNDALELGRSTPNELPMWFASAAQTLNVTWETYISSNVRGAKRQRICDWLVP